MPSKIILKKSNVTTKAPSPEDLEFGELALNYTDSKLYFKKSDGTTIDSFSSSAVAGTVTSVVGTGSVSGLTLSGTVTSSGSLTLGGTLSLTSANVTGALGYTPYNATNPNGYTTNTGTVTSVSGTGSVAGLSLGGTVTTSGNLSLSGTLSASIDNITDEHRLFNNMGDNHSTRSSFDVTNPSYNFGWRYIQGSGNSPGVNSSSQYYSVYVGLGNDYPATGAGSYGMQIAFPRSVTNPYISIRYNENNSLGAWQKISAGYADTAGSATDSTKLPLSGGTMTGTLTGVTGTTVSFGAGTSTASEYNYVLGASNDTGTKLVIFVNGSARSADGGGNATTIRSDGGALVLGNVSYNTNLLGSTVTVVGNVALHANNYTSYSPSLTGSGATGTWGINVTGSAGSLSNTADYMINRGGVAQASIDSAIGLGVWSQNNSGDSHTALVFGSGGSTSTVQQRFHYTGSMEFRNKTDSANWNGWKTVLTSSNFNVYAPGLTGGNASGTWGISVTGNAATITNQANSATINASIGVNGNDIVRRDGNGYIYANHVNFSTGEGENPTISSFITSNGDGWSRKSSLAHVKNSIRGVADGTWGIDVTGYSTQVNLGNSASQQLLGNTWAGTAGYPGYSFTGGNSRFGFSSTGGYVDVYTDGNFYAGIDLNGSNNLVLHAGNYSGYSAFSGNVTTTGRVTVGSGQSSSWLDMVDTDEGTRYLHNNSGTIGFVGSDGNWAFRVADDGNVWLRNRGWFDDVVMRKDTSQTMSAKMYTVGFQPTGVGGNSGVAGEHYKFGYQEAGDWNWPYPDLIIGYHTGMKMGANTSYGGIRFYSDHPSLSSTEIFSIGNGDGNVRVANTLFIGGNTALDAGNYNSYSPTLTGGSASGTWGINVTGNAATATTATNANQLGGISSDRAMLKRRTRIASFDGTSLNTSITAPEMGYSYGGSGEPVGPYIAFGGLSSNIDYSCQLAGGYSSGGNDFKIRTYNGDSGAWNAWRTILTNGNYTSYSPTLTGSGASGTWGISVTGSAGSVAWTNVSGRPTAVSSFTNDSAYITTAGARSALSFTAGSGAYNSTTGVITIPTNTNQLTNGAGFITGITVNYNNDSNSTYQMLWGSGNAVYGTSGIYCNPFTDILYASQLQATSDERLKTNWRDLESDFVEKLAKVKHGVYDRIDIELTQAGVSAQDWEKLLPEVVGKNEDGILSLNYANAALVSAVQLAKRVVEQEARIKRLEALIEKLIGE